MIIDVSHENLFLPFNQTLTHCKTFIETKKSKDEKNNIKKLTRTVVLMNRVETGQREERSDNNNNNNTVTVNSIKTSNTNMEHVFIYLFVLGIYSTGGPSSSSECSVLGTK